jgi:hypothetical protein
MHPNFAPPRIISPLEALAIREGRYPVTRFLLTVSAPPEATKQPSLEQPAASDHEPGKENGHAADAAP